VSGFIQFKLDHSFVVSIRGRTVSRLLVSSSVTPRSNRRVRLYQVQVNRQVAVMCIEHLQV